MQLYFNNFGRCVGARRYAGNILEAAVGGAFQGGEVRAESDGPGGIPEMRVVTVMEKGVKEVGRRVVRSC